MKRIEKIIFSTRWMLIPFYLTLMIALIYYLIANTIWFVNHVVHLSNDANIAMLFLVEVMDLVMIANLAKMVVTGSYNSFVSKSHGYKNENISSGMLKVKMATSLIGISSIHLLKVFVSTESFVWETINKQLAIHGAFIVGATVLAFIDFLHEKSQLEEEKFHHQTRGIHRKYESWKDTVI